MIVVPTDAAPLTEDELRAIHDCISERDKFVARCYREEDLRDNVIRAVSLVSGEKYLVPGSSDKTFRDLFKEKIREHDHDREFLDFINFLDKLVDDASIDYERLREILHSDSKGHLLATDEKEMYLYLLSEVPDKTGAIIAARGKLGETSQAQRILNAANLFRHDYKVRMEFWINRFFKNPSSEFGVKFNTKFNFVKKLAYLMTALEMESIDRFVSKLKVGKGDMIGPIPADDGEEFMFWVADNFPPSLELTELWAREYLRTTTVSLSRIGDEISGGFELNKCQRIWELSHEILLGYQRFMGHQFMSSLLSSDSREISQLIFDIDSLLQLIFDGIVEKILANLESIESTLLGIPDMDHMDDIVTNAEKDLGYIRSLTFELDPRISSMAEFIESSYIANLKAMKRIQAEIPRATLRQLIGYEAELIGMFPGIVFVPKALLLTAIGTRANAILLTTPDSRKVTLSDLEEELDILEYSQPRFLKGIYVLGCRQFSTVLGNDKAVGKRTSSDNNRVFVEY